MLSGVNRLLNAAEFLWKANVPKEITDKLLSRKTREKGRLSGWEKTTHFYSLGWLFFVAGAAPTQIAVDLLLNETNYTAARIE